MLCRYLIFENRKLAVKKGSNIEKKEENSNIRTKKRLIKEHESSMVIQIVCHEPELWAIQQEQVSWSKTDLLVHSTASLRCVQQHAAQTTNLLPMCFDHLHQNYLLFLGDGRSIFSNGFMSTLWTEHNVECRPGPGFNHKLQNLHIGGGGVQSDFSIRDRALLTVTASSANLLACLSNDDTHGIVGKVVTNPTHPRK